MNVTQPQEQAKYPWYGVVSADAEIEQGDFLSSCPVIVPSMKVKVGSVPAEVKEFDVVVMSQSCDLAERKIEIVLVCPVWGLDEFGKSNTYYAGHEGRETLRQGHAAGYHLLNRCTIADFECDFRVVDYRSIFGVDIDHLHLIAESNGSRLRLLPPYREHLSQAFARFFMRVGLPADIPRFEKMKKTNA